MLELFKIIAKIDYLYYLKLLKNIKIYNIFYSSCEGTRLNRNGMVPGIIDC